jgi:hypothetical protein
VRRMPDNGLFALRRYHPSARRVYQPAASPVRTQRMTGRPACVSGDCRSVIPTTRQLLPAGNAAWAAAGVACPFWISIQAAEPPMAAAPSEPPATPRRGISRGAWLHATAELQRADSPKYSRSMSWMTRSGRRPLPDLNLFTYGSTTCGPPTSSWLELPSQSPPATTLYCDTGSGPRFATPVALPTCIRDERLGQP